MSASAHILIYNRSDLVHTWRQIEVKRVFYEVQYSDIKQTELTAQIMLLKGVDSLMVLQPQQISCDVRRMIGSRSKKK